LAEAQRCPDDYDGLVAGAPANYRTHSWPGELWPPYVTHRSAANTIPQEKLAVIHQGALAACDANDGLVDGVINDLPRRNFDPSVLLCQGADSPDCLTVGEVDSVRLNYQFCVRHSAASSAWVIANKLTAASGAVQFQPYRGWQSSLASPRPAPG